MKVITILGTRPEIIRLSRITPVLDELVEHKVIHTGQNYDPKLSSIFYEELKLRLPDYQIASTSNNSIDQISCILSETEKILQLEKPDRILILGDTNSALTAIVAKRLGIPVFHMEAGNRCFDDRVPEEVNRRLVDHSSFVLLPYTERSRANLISENILSKRVYVTGNPIFEVLEYYKDQIDSSNVLSRLGAQVGKYFLVTLHRAENVDLPDRLSAFVGAMEELYKLYRYPVICSVHPRTKSQLEKNGQSLEGRAGIISLEPLGLFDFVKLEKHAACVLSDSGTVQEECAIFGTPNITLRDVTERPETLEVGSNFITGCSKEEILLGVKTVIRHKVSWKPPTEYMTTNVSEIVVRLVLSHWEK